MRRNASEASLGAGAMFAGQPSPAQPPSGDTEGPPPLPLPPHGMRREVDGSAGPKVEGLAEEAKPVKQSAIGARKPVKTSKLGAKKGKLGATKVKTDFSQIEADAAQYDKVSVPSLAAPSRTLGTQEKEEAAAKILFAAQEPAKGSDADVGKLSSRLMVQDLSGVMSKEEERLKASDPGKASSVERLGMGASKKSKVTSFS